jgi:VWFA-related protein
MARGAIPSALFFMAGATLGPTGIAQTAPSNEPAPTFRAATRLVEVDVVARSKGAPATGLTREDFTLLDNGKPQKIAFFSVRSARASGPAALSPPAGAVSNRLERDGPLPARATILLVDQKNTPPDTQAFAIQRIKTFARTSRNRDRFGIYSFGKDGELHAVQELTDDRQLLVRGANTLKAMDPYYRTQDTTGMSDHAAQAFSTETVLEQVAVTKRVLTTIARHLTKVPGRKNLIWITTAFPLFLEGVDFRPDVEQAARALNDANIALYPVDARGLIGALQGLTAIPNAEVGGPASPRQLLMQMGRGESPSPRGLNTENMFADLTGGLVFYNKSNAIEDSIQAAVDDGELTYTLGFYPAQAEQDGASHNLHNLKVEVARRGVSVRYRQNYFTSTLPAAANERPTLEALLKDSLDATQLELVAETSPDPARPGSWQVRVSIDLHDVQLENRNNTWSGAVDVSFFIEGSPTARTISRKIEIPEDQFAAALEKGILVNDSIVVNGPTRELHIVAQDRATGAAGSVRIALGKR